MKIGTYIPKSEAARSLGVSRRALYRMICKGLVPCDTAGRITRCDFEALFDEATGAAQ
jgi:hypothetical protein